MFVVDFELTSGKGRTLWSRSIAFRNLNQVSLGRSFVCDVSCPFFSSNEWVLISFYSNFILLEYQRGCVFGIRQVDHFFRRNRRLRCTLKSETSEPQIELNGTIDFSIAYWRSFIPDACTYLSSPHRSAVLNILMDDAIGSLLDEKESKISSRLILELVKKHGQRALPPHMTPRKQLAFFVDVFWMTASYLHAEGPLTGWLRSPDVREVLFNGHDTFWIELKSGLQRCSSPFESWDDLYAWLSRYATIAGRELVTARGCSDFSLSIGSRVHVVLSPLSRVKGYVSIRCHRESGLSLDDLAEMGTMTIEQKKTLENWILEKKNILLVGATSTGKTTLLKALADRVSCSERIVVLEDVSELKLEHENCVYLQTLESQGDSSLRPITLEDLVRESLRMRPDRLVVGECRGNEAFALVQALHTGHKGSFSTLHANTPHDALRRLEMLVLRAEPSLNPTVVRQMIVSAFDCVVSLERSGDSKRRVACLSIVQELM